MLASKRRKIGSSIRVLYYLTNDFVRDVGSFRFSVDKKQKYQRTVAVLVNDAESAALAAPGGSIWQTHLKRHVARARQTYTGPSVRLELRN